MHVDLDFNQLARTTFTGAVALIVRPSLSSSGPWRDDIIDAHPFGAIARHANSFGAIARQTHQADSFRAMVHQIDYADSSGAIARHAPTDTDDKCSRLISRAYALQKLSHEMLTHASKIQSHCCCPGF